MFSSLTAWLIAAGGALIMLLAAWMRGRLSGERRERDKQAAQEIKARDIADEVQNDVGAMPPADARQELRRWAR